MQEGGEAEWHHQGTGARPAVSARDAGDASTWFPARCGQRIEATYLDRVARWTINGHEPQVLNLTVRKMGRAAPNPHHPAGRNIRQNALAPGGDVGVVGRAESLRTP